MNTWTKLNNEICAGEEDLIRSPVENPQVKCDFCSGTMLQNKKMHAVMCAYVRIYSGTFRLCFCNTGPDLCMTQVSLNATSIERYLKCVLVLTWVGLSNIAYRDFCIILREGVMQEDHSWIGLARNALAKICEGKKGHSYESRVEHVCGCVGGWVGVRRGCH